MSAFNTLSHWVRQNRDVVFDLLRIYLGIGLFVRGVLFFADPASFRALLTPESASWLTSPPVYYAVSVLHLVGGLMLTAGFLTRLAALIQIPVLLGAVFLIHYEGGLFTASQSFEFSTLVLFLLALVFLHGPGRWSVDHKMDWHLLKNYPALHERLNRYGDVALEFLRIYLGIGLFVRGVLFIADSTSFMALVGEESWFTSVALIHYVAIAHLVGGVMMAVGLLTRVAALIQMPVLLGAVFLVHFQGGLLGPSQSLEFSALVLFLLGILFLYGSGRLSVDYYFLYIGTEREEEGILARMAARNIPKHTDPPPELLGLEPHPETGLTCPLLADCPVIAMGANAREHPWVKARASYSTLGAIFFLGGVTAPPKKVNFLCTRCGQVVDRSSDHEVLDAHRYP